MHLAFAVNIVKPAPAQGAPPRQFGTAILSRYPIVSSSNTHLYRSPNLEQRGLLRAVIDVHGVLVDAYNTHLEVSSESDRLRQAAQIKSLIGTPGAPTVLTGDMNAAPDTPEIATLKGFLTDTWPVAGAGPGYTSVSSTPTRRIDYVFGAGGVKPMTDRLIGTDPAASDHLPVVATLELTGSRDSADRTSAK
jgi:endonuclease/exonuclease/phosphatase family metal-dependent hydrolase